ncbi:MAG: NRDE family protein [Acidiferrobacterales bacterium]|nr:NRDE family protein [Acidiferrobacterales bacterium]
MCILFIAIRQHPKYPLIITANRDEFHGRPSQSFREWPDSSGLWAGRDLEAGGTWLGVNRSGQFAAVTNFRTAEDSNPNALSRGELVVNALSPCEQSESEQGNNTKFDCFLDTNFKKYNPFNLIYGNQQSLQAWDYSLGTRRRLDPGFHSVSNGPIDDHWPKMSQGVKQVADLISRRGDLDPDMLTAMMQDQTRAPIDQLPKTGISVEKEQMLSSIFIEGAEYGTRTTTILLFNHENIEVKETNYTPEGMVSSVEHQKLAMILPDAV